MVAPHTPAETHGYLETSQSPITSKMHFFNSVTGDGKLISTYRVLDAVGQPIEGAELPEASVMLFTG
jgi:2-oxoisovalerate dehydrogenase E1 component alpha subunit